MKKSKSLLILFLLYIACQDYNIELSTLPTKTKDGLVNVLITTKKSDSLISEYSYNDKKLVLSKEINFLKDIAHLGLIAGYPKMKKVIVLGSQVGKTRIKKVKPIGLVNLEFVDTNEEWFIFAEQASSIKSFDDFMLNHFSNKDDIQNALLRNLKNQNAKIIWRGENFLNSRLNKALSL